MDSVNAGNLSPFRGERIKYGKSIKQINPKFLTFLSLVTIVCLIPALIPRLQKYLLIS